MHFLPKKVIGTQQKPLSFNDWIKENSNLITTYLLEQGIAFIVTHAERLKSPLTTLITDNRWHYLDKPKKESYRAILNTNAFGVPYLNLSYYSFRHGGVSARFDSKASLKELWKQALSGRSYVMPFKTTAAVVNKTDVLPIDYLERDKAIWNAMPNTGRSGYLKRKGLGNAPITGIRFGRQHISVAIINTQNQYQGLQTITDEGDKRFTRGLHKKGHFALIGCVSLPEKIPAIHICEGVATAASIHLSLDEPVFAALDAFNLLPVARNLKKKYPKTQIIIWADNDWQKASKTLSNARLLGNTGLIHANRAAFKLRDALVATPDMTHLPILAASVDAWIEFERIIKSMDDALSFLLLALADINCSLWMSLLSIVPCALQQLAINMAATDFNDLYQIIGRDAITSVTPQRPNIKLALTNELYQYRRYQIGVLSPQQFETGQRTTYSTRYLSDIEFDAGVHLIKSPIGSGKTAIVEKLVKAHPKQSVLFTTHLISLVESAAARLNLCSYNTCDAFDLHIESRLAICLNSLSKLTLHAPLRDYDIVIVDEIEQVLARLTTHIEQKPLVFAVLMRILSSAKVLIGLDAHLSKATTQFIQAVCGNKPVTIHINTHMRDETREIILHENAESVQLSAMNALHNNKTAFLTFNSKADAFKTFSTIKAALPEKKGLYIASDNSGDVANQAFFKDVNTVSAEYDYLVCTPSVSTGVSIDNNHFDFVGGIFLAHVNTANDCMQALGRVRNAPIRHVYCEKRFGSHPLDTETIAARWTNTHQHDLNLMSLSNTGARVLMNDDYEDLCVAVTQTRNRSLNDFYQSFALLCLDEGIVLSYTDAPIDADTRKQFKQLKQAFVQIEAQTVGLVPIEDSIHEMRALLNTPHKTMQETRQLKKQQLIEFYQLDKEDSSGIEAFASIDHDNRFKQCIHNLELALADTTHAKAAFLQQTEKHAQFAADVRHFATEQALYQRLLKVLCLIDDTAHYHHNNQSSRLLEYRDFQYTREDILTSGFIDYIETHRAALCGIISLPSPETLRDNPLRFISMVLAKMGLRQKRVGRAENATYQIDTARIEFLNAILMRRRIGQMATHIPIDTSSVKICASMSVDIVRRCLQSMKDFLMPVSMALTPAFT
jgi:hypothetical protein